MWVCVCVVFVMCGCFGNICTCIYCVFVWLVMCFIYCLVYIYLFALCLLV